ncbi:hypothetical protein KIL84_010123 [Mauremys mutica]|uniref:Uncharacterized protein n=1 Tax=Mauremys mutica TaxID=74926 RepID=A0A9D4B6U1_9SAUR|nr:hypothetical protein KIL84_010123 [Mauremys mutica]
MWVRVCICTCGCKRVQNERETLWKGSEITQPPDGAGLFLYSTCLLCSWGMGLFSQGTLLLNTMGKTWICMESFSLCMYVCVSLSLLASCFLLSASTAGEGDLINPAILGIDIKLLITVATRHRDKATCELRRFHSGAGFPKD